MSRHRKSAVIPAEAIRAAYLDLDTSLTVAGKRLGCRGNSIIKRALAMGLPSRGVLLTQRARARVEKCCKRCQETRPATAEHFDVDLRNRDGLDSYCKGCRRCAANASNAKRAKPKAKEPLLRLVNPERYERHKARCRAYMRELRADPLCREAMNERRRVGR